MESRAVGRSGLQVSRTGLGTMTWGRDTDEYEARDQFEVAHACEDGGIHESGAGDDWVHAHDLLSGDPGGRLYMPDFGTGTASSSRSTSMSLVTPSDWA